MLLAFISGLMTGSLLTAMMLIGARLAAETDAADEAAFRRLQEGNVTYLRRRGWRHEETTLEKEGKHDK
jgi:hypothetical protein